MNTSTKRWSKFAAVPLIAALILSGCGSDDDSSDTSDGGDSAAGTVNISGSSTVSPIGTRVAELAEDAGLAGEVNVDGPGTGDGFLLFCEGETDISNASRPIKGEELEICEDNGIEFVELKIAFDGLSVIVNPENDIECLNFADLYALVGPESGPPPGGDFQNWEDAQALAEELGSETTFPEGSLDITAPGEESGTFDSFVELALGPISEARFEEGKITEEQVETSRPDYSSSADDNAILQGIAGSSTSFGWVGLSYVEESGDLVRAVPIASEPGGDCVEPTSETVADGSYPISRPLFIYVSTAKAEENEALVEYVDFFLSDEGLAAVPDVGYVSLTDEQIEETRGFWDDRTVGTRDGGE